jgi:hypothetical protein
VQVKDVDGIVVEAPQALLQSSADLVARRAAAGVVQPDLRTDDNAIPRVQLLQHAAKVRLRLPIAV